MPFLPAEKRWRLALLLAVALFIGIRCATLLSFPIFNDEALYLQYSQFIHDDWAKNKFVSMDNQYNDWKPPLQYWLAAPVIRWGGDPLAAGRAVSFAVSLLGLVGFYLFARELLTEREGVLTAWLYVLCPPVLFHNNQFIAETYLFSTAPFVYWAVLHAIRPNKNWWRWGLLAVAFGTALLLFKQSGFLLLVLSIFLPVVRLDSSLRDWNWRACVFGLVVVAAIIFFAQAAATAVLPAEFEQTRERFNANWVMTARELLQLPTSAWAANLNLVADYIGSYYSWMAAVFVTAALWFAWQRRSLPQLALLLMFSAGAAGVTFLLRAFNEYLFNTAVIAVLLPLLASTAVPIWNLSRAGSARLFRGGLLVFAAVMLAYWSYQIVLMDTSPGKYVEQSTPWAASNYLKSWPSGFGVKEIVAMLEKEKRPGLILADPQWGNPRVALEVYGKERFPNLRVIPIPPEIRDPDSAAALTEHAKNAVPVRFAIYSADSSGRRREWQQSVERDLCQQRQEVKAYDGQMPIVICQF